MDLRSVKSAVGIWNQKGKFIIEYFMGPIIFYLQWLTWQTVQTLMHFEIKIQLQLVIMQGIMQFSLTIYSDVKIQVPATSQSSSSDIIFISIVLTY